MITYKVALCIGAESNGDKPLVIKCHDTGFNLRVSLFIRRLGEWRDELERYTIPEDGVAVLKITKPDDTYCMSDGVIDSNKIFFAIPPQAFTVAGEAKAEVAVYDVKGRRVTTATFSIDVPSECICEGLEQSEDFIDIVGKQIARAGNAAERAEKAAADAEGYACHPPIVGENGNWWEWDGEAYMDTGKPSQGQDGKDGATGADGAPGKDGEQGPPGPAYELTEEDKQEIVEDVLRVTAETDKKYFDIDDNGLLSLKPEYRGACPSSWSGYTYAISDNGLDVVGSKNAELPQNIVIPEVVNEIAVTALVSGMFVYNSRVVSIKVPASTRELPDKFCDNARGLRSISGTENVRKIGKTAFQCTGIDNANFPNLQEDGLGGDAIFSKCYLLVTANLGGKIKTLPRRTFNECERLSRVDGVESVTSIGIETFYRTLRLKNLSCLPNVISIGNNGFRLSRVIYDWNSLNCSFGTYATAKQVNPTDFWSGCTFEACENTLRSTHNQYNPQWVNDNVGNTTVTYKDGCLPCCAAAVYSALEGVDIASPKDFVALVGAKDTNLLSLDPKQLTTTKAWFDALGYATDIKTSYSAANLQAMYDALKQGGMVITGVMNANSLSGHAMLVYGVKSNGELLVYDTGSAQYNLGINEGVKFPTLVQNAVHGASCGFLIISKK